jgi:hypothetical protein
LKPTLRKPQCKPSRLRVKGVRHPQIPALVSSVQGCIAVSKGAEIAEGNRLKFGRRRKLNFIYREKRVVWVAFSRK